MSRLIIGQITIKKERTISSTEWYYLLQPANANPPDSSNYGNPPPIITDTGYSGWSTTEPTYTIGDERVLYQMVQTTFSDESFSYTAPTISSSYEAAKAAYDEALQAESDIQDLQELGLHQGYIWYNSTAKAASGSIPAYPVGSYIASGINNTINQANSNTYGLNTWISTGGINLRYNAIDLAKLTTSALEFYYPSTSQQGSTAISLGTHGGINSLIFYRFGSSDKQMELTGSSLSFYGSSQNNADATLNSNGLKLVKGGIEAGVKNTTDYIYVWSVDDATDHTFSINNSGNKSDWRIIAGQQFGVDKAGNLYASNVDINGIINAESGSIGGFEINNTQLYSNGHDSPDSNNNGIYIGSDKLAFGPTLTTYFENTGSGKIGPWYFDDGNIYINIDEYRTIKIGTNGLVLTDYDTVTNSNFETNGIEFNFGLQNDEYISVQILDKILIKDNKLTINADTITLNNEDLTAQLSSIDQNITDNKQRINNAFTYINNYEFYIATTPNDTSGYIQLKRKANNNASSVKITDNIIELSINQNNITTYSGNLMHTTFGEFENLRMRVGTTGSLTWIARSNGHLSLKVVN